MDPIAFTIAGVDVRWAGLIYAACVVVAGLHARRVARRAGWNPDLVLSGLAVVVPAAWAGARLHAVLVSQARLAADPTFGLLQEFQLSFFGGLAGGVAAIIVFTRWARLPTLQVTDALALSGPLLYALFRVGCFLNGDDYGNPTNVPWGIRFPNGSPPAPDPVHPVQLYEVALMMPVFIVLTRRRTQPAAGTITFELCLLLGLERFLIDFMRREPGLSSILGSQYMALLLFIVGVTGLALVRKSSASAT